MKGIVFTTDALLAALVLVIILVAFAYLRAQTQTDNFPNLYLSKIAYDALTVLDRNKTLATLDAGKINASLAKILPGNIAGRLEIAVYEWDNGQFELEQQITVQTAKFDNSTFLTARRSFLTFSNRQIQYYNIAELGVGLK